MKIRFGKHFGKEFSQIAKEDPSYLEWIISTDGISKIAKEHASIALSNLVSEKLRTNKKFRKKMSAATKIHGLLFSEGGQVSVKDGDVLRIDNKWYRCQDGLLYPQFKLV